MTRERGWRRRYGAVCTPSGNVAVEDRCVRRVEARAPHVRYGRLFDGDFSLHPAPNSRAPCTVAFVVLLAAAWARRAPSARAGSVLRQVLVVVATPCAVARAASCVSCCRESAVEVQAVCASPGRAFAAATAFARAAARSLAEFSQFRRCASAASRVAWAAAAVAECAAAPSFCMSDCAFAADGNDVTHRTMPASMA